MYQAAICEDNSEMLSILQKEFIKYFNDLDMDVAFDCFSDGNGLIKMIDDHYHYDMVFMDIEMPGKNGIDVCKYIKSVNSNVLIIFISGKDELVFQTFDVQPFRFIRKSHFKESLPGLVWEIKNELINLKEKYIYLVDSESGEKFAIDVQGIYYIEAQGKNCYIHYENNSIEVRTTLAALYEKVEKYGFLQVHRSYLVNCKYIFHIKKNSVCLVNRVEISISRHRIGDVKKRFIEYASGDYYVL